VEQLDDPVERHIEERQRYEPASQLQSRGDHLRVHQGSDVIRIVLIAYDPDDLAAIEPKAFAQYFDQEVGDIVPTARLDVELVGDQGAHATLLSYSESLPFAIGGRSPRDH
jgi:hypothetical protein